MRLLVDVQALQSPETRDRGIGRYARSLLNAMTAARPGWCIELVESRHLEPADRGRLPALPVHAIDPPVRIEAGHGEANGAYYADWLAAQAANALLLLSVFDPHLVVPDLRRSRPAVAAAVYDLIPLVFADHYLAEPRERSRYGTRLRRLLAADCLLAISEATARDLRDLCPSPWPRLAVVGGAADPEFAPLADVELRAARQRLAERFGLSRDFILYVGGFDFRKNLAGALRSYAYLPARFRRAVDLAVVCKLSDGQRDFLDREAAALGIGDGVKFPGFVGDDDLRAMYNLCRLFFFPSLYEGLGIPVLEALACGAPVVASSMSSIPEVAGPAARLFDPREPEQGAAALRAALEEPRDKLRAERLAHAAAFTWETAAERACRAVEAGPRPRSVRPRRRRVAWVSPVPPAPSGIADYSAEVVAELDGRFEVELVVDPAEALPSADVAHGRTVLLAEEVPGRHDARPFDAFIYQLGNSHFHTYMVGLMQRYRGIGVVHDFFLGGMMLHVFGTDAWPPTLAEELESEGQRDLAAAWRARSVSELDILERAPLSRRILTVPALLAVHSAWAHERVRGVTTAPVVRLPQAVTTPPAGPGRKAERVRLALPTDAFVIASLGVVGPAKRIPSLLYAVGRLPEALRKCVVVAVVGPIRDEERREFAQVAASLGIGDTLRMTGRVALDELTAYARAADVCVQLRYPTRGESSAALLRALAAGAPCVTSDHGSIAEVPDDVVLKVRTPEHEIEDLVAALVRLEADRRLGARLGERGARFARERHSPMALAERYAALIELFVADRARRDGDWLDTAAAGLAAAEPTRAREFGERWAELRSRTCPRGGSSSDPVARL